MSYHTTPDAEAEPGKAHQHSARAHALDEAALDHHKEELLGAFGDLDQRAANQFPTRVTS